MIELSHLFNVVGSFLLSHQIPCRLSSLNETRLHRISGQKATFSNRSISVPYGDLTLTCTVPYALIHICVSLAHTQSPGMGGRRSVRRCAMLQMCIVAPESRMNAFFSGYGWFLIVNTDAVYAASIVDISLPSSQSFMTSGVGVCEFLISGVLDRWRFESNNLISSGSYFLLYSTSLAILESGVNHAGALSSFR